VLNGFDRLELSTETLRELNADELTRVAGGAPPEPTPPIFAVTHFNYCPSGPTWTANCQVESLGC
jgi:hypothetical protein